jgi:hypothetical protein
VKVIDRKKEKYSKHWQRETKNENKRLRVKERDKSKKVCVRENVKKWDSERETQRYILNDSKKKSVWKGQMDNFKNKFKISH